MSSVFLFSKQEIQKDSVEQGIYQLFDVRPKIEVFSKRISGQYPYGLEVYEMDGFRCSDERLGTELVSKLAKHLKMELVITVINAVEINIIDLISKINSFTFGFCRPFW